VAFSREALDTVYQASKGIPRLINKVCDFVMLTSFTEQTREVDAAMVHDIVQELELEQQHVVVRSEPAAAAKRALLNALKTTPVQRSYHDDPRAAGKRALLNALRAPVDDQENNGRREPVIPRPAPGEEKEITSILQGIHQRIAAVGNGDTQTKSEPMAEIEKSSPSLGNRKNGDDEAPQSTVAPQDQKSPEEASAPVAASPGESLDGSSGGGEVPQSTEAPQDQKPLEEVSAPAAASPGGGLDVSGGEEVPERSETPQEQKSQEEDPAPAAATPGEDLHVSSGDEATERSEAPQDQQAQVLNAVPVIAAAGAAPENTCSFPVLEGEATPVFGDDEAQDTTSITGTPGEYQKLSGPLESFLKRVLVLTKELIRALWERGKRGAALLQKTVKRIFTRPEH
jgi:hypothetical protein